MPKYDFKFGQFWLSEFGAVSAEEPSMEIAQRDVTFISIPGKDGKDCIDNKRYDNVEFKRKIAFVGNRDFNVREKEHSLINSYAYLQGYQDFEDVHHPGFITKAALKNFNAVQRNLRTMHTAELSFTRLPFWYLKTALEEIPLDINKLTDGVGVELHNPLPALAKPILKFDVNFTGGAVSGGAETTTCRIAFAIAANYNGVYEERTFNKPSIRITATHHFVVIDIENQRASVQDANGNIYSFIDMPIPDPVGPGKVNVRITTLSKTNALSIIPRWRCL